MSVKFLDRINLKRLVILSIREAKFFDRVLYIVVIFFLFSFFLHSIGSAYQILKFLPNQNYTIEKITSCETRGPFLLTSFPASTSVTIRKFDLILSDGSQFVSDVSAYETDLSLG